jgi:hypothetical protein
MPRDEEAGLLHLLLLSSSSSITLLLNLSLSLSFLSLSLPPTFLPLKTSFFLVLSLRAEVEEMWYV